MLALLLVLALLALLFGLFTTAKFLIFVAVLLAVVGVFVHLSHGHDTTV